MNLDDTPEQQAFRLNVREFLRSALPADIREKVVNHKRLSRDDYVRWHRVVHERGWAGASWPIEHGGTGWSTTQQHIWDEESSLAGSPGIQPFGVNMVAPVIMAYGNEAQKKHYLPRVLSCEDWWCQGYSEPGAGSDLAALRMRAERRGGRYVLNGQKTWTTMAQHANMMFCLVRTDSSGRKQEGISFLLIDMKTPGITVCPIMLLHGEPDVNDVFFEDVEVPVENLIGEEGRGWTYAKYLLGHERTSIAGVGRSKRELRCLKQLAARQLHRGLPLIENPLFAADIAHVEVELMALELTALRVASHPNRASAPLASTLKIVGTEVQQRLTELMMKVAGPSALPFDPEFLECGRSHSLAGQDEAAGLAAAYFQCRSTTIYGGSTEVQKNIIAQHGLGL